MMRRWYVGSILRESWDFERIVIDEGHDMQEGVKARIETTWNELAEALFAYKAQLIILTATLPPYLVPAYQKQLRRDDFNIIREPSDRPNIAYHYILSYVRAISDAYNYEDIIQQLVSSLTNRITQSSTPSDRILVFFPGREMVEAFGTAHEYLWYHSCCTKSALAQRLASWDRLDSRVLVATTAMAQGLDRSNVRYVIAANVPYGISTVAQMMGRAGRDGLASDMFFIGPAIIPLDLSTRWHEDSILAQHHLNSTDTCQRHILATSLDGPKLSYQCITEGSTVVNINPCGTCAPRSAMHRLALEAVENARVTYASQSSEFSAAAISSNRVRRFKHVDKKPEYIREASSSVNSWSSQLAQQREEHRQTPRYSHAGEEMPIGKPWKTLSEHGARLPQAVVRALDKVPSSVELKQPPKWVRFIDYLMPHFPSSRFSRSITHSLKRKDLKS